LEGKESKTKISVSSKRKRLGTHPSKKRWGGVVKPYERQEVEKTEEGRHREELSEVREEEKKKGNRGPCSRLTVTSGKCSQQHPKKPRLGKNKWSKKKAQKPETRTTKVPRAGRLPEKTGSDGENGTGQNGIVYHWQQRGEDRKGRFLTRKGGSGTKSQVKRETKRRERAREKNVKSPCEAKNSQSTISLEKKKGM